MNAYAISLSKYVNTGIVALFTLLSYLGLTVQGRRLLRGIEIFQRVLLAAFLINANMTVAWFVGGAGGRRLILLCAMEVLFLLAFMVLYRIVHEMANMLLFNNICMLLSIGFVMISRICYYGSADDTVYSANVPIKQFIMASAGLMLMLIIPFFRRLFDSMRHMGLVFGIVGIAALGAVLLVSGAINGANITYTIAGFTFQPSEFVKILFILMMAGMLSGEVTAPKAALVTILALLHVGILVLSRDLGSALIFFMVYLMVLFLATGRWRVLFGGLALGGLGAAACYFLFSHVRVRVLIWRDPLAEGVIDNLGYQVAQSLFALGYGGLWGAGLTQGSPTSIPLVESDFIFSAITEEMGLVFGVCLLLLCINCFLRIIALSSVYSNRFFQLFTYGAAVCYIFQTFMTVGGETKFIPLTGVTLPLVSYGGSSVLSTLIMLGIVEMIFILHDERTMRFEVRYEMEHPGGPPDRRESEGGPMPPEAQRPQGLADAGDRNSPQDSEEGSFWHIPRGLGSVLHRTAQQNMQELYGHAEQGVGKENIPDEDQGYDSGTYGDALPDDFPANGVSEEGIFEDY